MQFPSKRKRKTRPGENAFPKGRALAHFKSLASTLVFVWLFTNHVAQAMIVPTESMLPTILVGDHFFLDKVAFSGKHSRSLQKILPERSVRRGDLIVFWSRTTGSEAGGSA